MRLYVNQNRTQWAGTQADAKRDLGQFDMYEVPTDKPGLLAFLNKEPGFHHGQVIEPALTQPTPKCVEDTVIRRPANYAERENTPTVTKGIRTKRVVCYLEYDTAADEVTNVQMVSQMQLAQDDYSSWDKLDQQLSENHDDA
jgi:hypothetical protein